MGEGPLSVLVADDQPASRRILEVSLRGWGYAVVVARDGIEAWEALQGDAPPSIALLDWRMPGMEGIEVCRRVRAAGRSGQPYLILLTARVTADDLAAGLDAGADDYIRKPFERTELRARLRVGERTVRLQEELESRVRALEAALVRVDRLESLLPICAWCHKVRNDQNYWQDLESYLVQTADTRFTHSVCPACREQMMRSLGKEGPETGLPGRPAG